MTATNNSTRYDAKLIALSAIDELGDFLDSYPDNRPKSESLRNTLWIAGHLERIYKLLFYILTQGGEGEC